MLGVLDNGSIALSSPPTDSGLEWWRERSKGFEEFFFTCSLKPQAQKIANSAINKVGLGILQITTESCLYMGSRAPLCRICCSK